MKQNNKVELSRGRVGTIRIGRKPKTEDFPFGLVKSKLVKAALTANPLLSGELLEFHERVLATPWDAYEGWGVSKMYMSYFRRGLLSPSRQMTVRLMAMFVAAPFEVVYLYAGRRLGDRNTTLRSERGQK